MKVTVTTTETWTCDLKRDDLDSIEARGDTITPANVRSYAIDLFESGDVDRSGVEYTVTIDENQSAFKVWHRRCQEADALAEGRFP